MSATSSAAPMDSSAFLFLLLPLTPFSALVILVLLALAAVFLFPGGVAWALSRAASLRLSRPIPGPPGPAVFAFTGPAAHRALARLASSCGALDLMAFSVGCTRFVVSSRPSTARELLNSPAFADRPIKESAYELLFHRAMGFAPSGEYWRHLRRISATHLFSPRHVAASGERRRSIGDGMVAEVAALMQSRGVVEIKRVLHYASLSSVMDSVFGKRFDFAKGEGEELEGLVREGYELLGAFNWSDHVPLLGWLDMQGLRRRCKRLVSKVNAFVGGIIEEHRQRRQRLSMSRAAAVPAACGGGSTKEDANGDFVDVLLDMEDEEKLSDSDMIAVLWEMIFRGTDTVAILMEWVMARMILHPDIQSKAQAEIDAAVGTSRRVSDADVANLHYLQAIVKETLRMHPPGPLLSWARLAIQDAHVGHHFVPAGTTAIVNMWAITHDESVWSEPNEFKPERFMEEDVSVLGSDLRLAPFGSGRRVCPGKAMALATVHLWLAQLLQGFKWMPTEAGVDLSECLKMSLEMEKPLFCKAVPRY